MNKIKILFAAMMASFMLLPFASFAEEPVLPIAGSVGLCHFVESVATGDIFDAEVTVIPKINFFDPNDAKVIMALQGADLGLSNNNAATGVPLGEIPGRDLVVFLFGIWFNPATQTANLRCNPAEALNQGAIDAGTQMLQGG